MSGAKNKKGKMVAGLAMLAVFMVVLVGFFMPLIGGKNGLDYLDNLYNSISKQSAYYIPGIQKQAEKYAGRQVELNLTYPAPGLAERGRDLMVAAGAEATADGDNLKVKGDLGAIMQSSLADSDAMFHNDGEKLSQRYSGRNPKVMLYTWWETMKAMQKSLNRQKSFDLAKFVGTVQAKAVETAYNYYKIEPQSIGDKWGIVVFSLLFYVLYTVWYGFAVMYLFEGAGFQLEH